MRDAMLFMHLIGVVLGVGTSFAFLFMGISMKKMSKEDADKLMLKLLPLSLMGRIGMALLLLSGGYLMPPYWKVMGHMPFLMAKLALVAVLLACIGVMEVYTKKAKINKGGEFLDKLQQIGKFTLPIGILIMLFAILTFH